MATETETQAANLIEGFEGYTPIARWDVNAYRLGYGSSTEGPQQVKVTKGMHTTRERAFENLVARIPAFESIIINQVGAASWTELPIQARAALISLAYNYGDLPDNVEMAVRRRQSLAMIASTVNALEGDNHGVNRDRRRKEASEIAHATPVHPVSAPAVREPSPVTVAHAEALSPNAEKPGYDKDGAIDALIPQGFQVALNVLLKLNPPLNVDGTIGPETVAAIKEFQKQHNLAVTGDTTTNTIVSVRDALIKAGIPTTSAR